jgi:hypothetical protein
MLPTRAIPGGKAVKDQLRRSGRGLRLRDIVWRAEAYLAEHPELLEEARETLRWLELQRPRKRRQDCFSLQLPQGRQPKGQSSQALGPIQFLTRFRGPEVAVSAVARRMLGGDPASPDLGRGS